MNTETLFSALPIGLDMLSVAQPVLGSWNPRAVIVPESGTKPAKESYVVVRMPAVKSTDLEEI